MLLRRTSALLLALVLASGCSEADPEPEAAPTPSSSPTATEPTLPPCADGMAGEIAEVTTSEGDTADVLVVGAGSNGVVLGPQDDGDICQWLEHADELAAGYRVAMYDWAEPRAEMPALAVAVLRRAGVRDVVLGGASYGAATALARAHTIRPRLAGVLSLGGELTLPGEDFRPGLRQWDGPLLQISSRDDDFFGAGDVAALRRIHPGPEEVLMLPGSAHGVDLLAGPHQRRVWAAIESFLEQTLG